MREIAVMREVSQVLLTDGKKKFRQDILQILPTVVKARLHFLPEFVQCYIIVQPNMKQGQVGRLC